MADQDNDPGEKSDQQKARAHPTPSASRFTSRRDTDRSTVIEPAMGSLVTAVPICLEPCRGHRRGDHEKQPLTCENQSRGRSRRNPARIGSASGAERPPGYCAVCASTAVATLRVCPAGELRADPVEDQQGCAGDLLG